MHLNLSFPFFCLTFWSKLLKTPQIGMFDYNIISFSHLAWGPVAILDTWSTCSARRRRAYIFDAAASTSPASLGAEYGAFLVHDRPATSNRRDLGTS